MEENWSSHRWRREYKKEERIKRKKQGADVKKGYFPKYENETKGFGGGGDSSEYLTLRDSFQFYFYLFKEWNMK